MPIIFTAAWEGAPYFVAGRPFEPDEITDEHLAAMDRLGISREALLGPRGEALDPNYTLGAGPRAEAEAILADLKGPNAARD